MKTEIYPSYVWSITCFIICRRTLNWLPCNIAKWPTILNMYRTAMYFHPCSLEQENYYMNTFLFLLSIYSRIINLFYNSLILEFVPVKLIKDLSRLMTKPTKRHVRPAKTQISLGIRPVWSESSLSAGRKLGSLATHWAHSEDSDQTGWMPRLIWVFVGCTVI